MEFHDPLSGKLVEIGSECLQHAFMLCCQFGRFSSDQQFRYWLQNDYTVGVIFSSDNRKAIVLDKSTGPVYTVLQWDKNSGFIQNHAIDRVSGGYFDWVARLRHLGMIAKESVERITNPQPVQSLVPQNWGVYPQSYGQSANSGQLMINILRDLVGVAGEYMVASEQLKRNEKDYTFYVSQYFDDAVIDLWKSSWS